MKKVNLSFILNDFSLLGGVENVTFNLATLFQANDINVHSIISLKEKEEPRKIKNDFFDNKVLNSDINDRDEFKKEIVSYLKINNINTLIIQLQNLEVAEKIIKAVKDLECKIIPILHNTPCIYTKWYFSKTSSINFFLRSIKMKYFWKPKNIKLFKNIVKETKLMVFVGEKAKSEFIQILPEMDNEYLKAIPNPLSFNQKKVKHMPKENWLIYAGRLTEDKNSLLMMELWKDLESKYPEWKFKILGDGEVFEEMKTYKEENKLVNVELLGRVYNVTDYYEKSKICILLSHYEGLPTTLLEASYYENALIAFDGDGGTSDIISNNDNGYLIKLNDKEAVLSKLTKMMDNNFQKQLKTMGKVSSDMLKENFSNEMIINKWKSVL